MNLSFDQWLQWIGATLVAAVTLVSFAYSTFATKEEHRDTKTSIEHRLDRLETKIDLLLEYKRRQ